MICVCEGALLIVVQPLLALAYGVPLKWLAVLPLASAPMILFMGNLWKAASPLSSSLVGSKRWAIGAHLSWILWWILALGAAWL